MMAAPVTTSSPRIIVTGALLTSVLILGGCAQAPKTLYEWGSYQSQVYEHFKGDGKSPTEQLQILEAQLQKSKASNAALPPGFYAHLGLLNIKLGQIDAGMALLRTEASLFPESKPYIEMLLERARASKS